MSDKYKDSKLAPHAGKMTETPAERDPGRQAQGAAGLQGRAVGDRTAGRARDGAVRRRQEGLRGHARHRSRVRGHRRRRQAHGAHGRRQAHAACRRRVQGRRAVRVRDRQGAEVRRHRQATRARSRRISPRSSSCRRSSITTGSTSPSAPTASSTCRSARRATSASRRQEYAQIRRYNADGSGKEVIATGVRNTVGFDWHPKTKELWFTDHGRDWMGDDGPADELNRLAKPGANFGFPYCHADGKVDSDFKKPDACKGVTRPVALMGPHAAAMGVKFYTGIDVPGRVPEHDVHRAQGLVEPQQAHRLRRRQRARERRRQEREGDAVPHRLQRGQGQLQVLGPAGVHRADARRFAAGQRRAGRRDLPHQLRKPAGSAAKKM